MFYDGVNSACGGAFRFKKNPIKDKNISEEEHRFRSEGIKIISIFWR